MESKNKTQRCEAWVESIDRRAGKCVLRVMQTGDDVPEPVTMDIGSYGILSEVIDGEDLTVVMEGSQPQEVVPHYHVWNTHDLPAPDPSAG